MTGSTALILFYYVHIDIPKIGKFIALTSASDANGTVWLTKEKFLYRITTRVFPAISTLEVIEGVIHVNICKLKDLLRPSIRLNRVINQMYTADVKLHKYTSTLTT